MIFKIFKGHAKKITDSCSIPYVKKYIRYTRYGSDAKQLVVLCLNVSARQGIVARAETV
jgi:hypothetical protein